MGVLKAIGALFIKYSLKWLETKENETILNNIIRLLQEYSRFKCYQSIIEVKQFQILCKYIYCVFLDEKYIKR